MGPEAKQRLETRAEELKRELAMGEERLRSLEAESARVRETVFRLEGALLAYGEVLGADQPPVPEPPGAPQGVTAPQVPAAS
jgi:hypothetical protein